MHAFALLLVLFVPGTYESAPGKAHGGCFARSHAVTFRADGTYSDWARHEGQLLYRGLGTWQRSGDRLILANAGNPLYFRVLNVRTLLRVGQNGRPWTLTCNNRYVRSAR